MLIAVAGAPKPRAVLRWLKGGSQAVAALGRITAGELALSHEALDRLPPSRALGFLEHLLVASGALPARDPALARLERWIDDRLAGISDPGQRQLVRTFARWIVLRRYRNKSQRSDLSYALLSRAKAELNGAAAFLAWLAERRRELGGCRQADIDAWLAQGPANRRLARPFVRWAISQRLVPRLDFPAGDRELTGQPVDPTERTETARRLLHELGIHPADRVAGALVVLFAQPLSRVAHLTVDDLTMKQGRVALRLGDTPFELPEPLAGQVRELVSRRRSLAAAALPADERWLFPGASPGRPIGELALGRRLRRLGVACAPNRRAAPLELPGEVPAPVLADLLASTSTPPPDGPSSPAATEPTTYRSDGADDRGALLLACSGRPRQHPTREPYLRAAPGSADCGEDDDSTGPGRRALARSISRRCGTLVGRPAEQAAGAQPCRARDRTGALDQI